MEKENINNTIEEDLNRRNRNWDKISDMIDDVDLLETKVSTNEDDIDVLKGKVSTNEDDIDALHGYVKLHLAERPTYEQVRQNTAVKPINVSEFDTETKQLFTGGSVAVVGEKAVGNENLKEKAVAPFNISFMKGTRNLFKGEYIKGTLFGRIIDGIYTLSPVKNGTQYNARTAVIPIKPSRVYTIKIHEPAKQDRLRIGVSSSYIEFQDSPQIVLDDALYSEFSGVIDTFTFTNNETGRFLYVNPSGTGQEPLMQVEEGEIATEYVPGLVIPSIYVENKSIAPHFNDEISKEAFIQEMNNRAKEIGMTNTNYVEPAGYPTVIEHYTTARDMVKLGVQAMGYKDIARIWGKKDYTVTILGENAREINITTLVKSSVIEDEYYILGGKTGSYWSGGDDPRDGYHLIMVVEAPNGEVLVGAIRGARSRSDRFEQLKIAFDNAVALMENPNAEVQSVTSSVAVAALPKITPFAYENYDIPLIFSNNPDEVGNMASTTKVMSAMVALDYSNNINDLIKFEEQDVIGGVGGTGHYFEPGDRLTLKDAIYSMLLPSSNTMSHAVARNIGHRILTERNS